LTAFDVAFSQLIGLEGKYSNTESDPGNWTGGAVNSGELKGTMYGISAAAYPTLDIAGISLAKAKSIYLQDYWDKLRCDSLPDSVAIALFKQGVNMGVAGATKALQRSLKVDQDGVIGQITVGYATNQPPKIVVQQFLTECAEEYIKMPNFATYGAGWISRIIQTAIEVQLSPMELNPDAVKN
jgi:lysozyme family protein